jgi:hypothetical protein
LYNTVISDIENDSSKKFEFRNNKYIYNTKVKYSNNSKLYGQKIIFDKKYKLNQVDVYDRDNDVCMKLTINKISFSPRFSKKAAYKYIGGRLPRLVNVPGYQGVLIHIGNSAKDSSGCLLVGKNTQVGKVLQSTDTFRALYAKMKEAKERGEEITITIE